MARRGIRQGLTALTNPRGLDHPPCAGLWPAQGNPDRYPLVEKFGGGEALGRLFRPEGKFVVKADVCEGNRLIPLWAWSTEVSYLEFICAVELGKAT